MSRGGSGMREKRLDQEVKQGVFIRASREKVYDAFATAEGLDGWFTRGSRVDPRPGGAMLFRWVDWGAEKSINTDVPGRVIEARRPERFVYEWGEPGSESTVEIVLEKRDDGTLVRLRSEEHTSELQSPCNLVCRLLLEKKK